MQEYGKYYSAKLQLNLRFALMIQLNFLGLKKANT